MDLEDIIFQPAASQREEQKEETHTLILAVALNLVRKGGEDAVTVRAVANAAGITERTVYRHFTSRDLLLQAVWQNTLRLIGPAVVPQSAAALIQKPQSLFPRLHRHRELARAFLYRREWRDGRRDSDEQGRQRMIRCVQEELEYLDEGSVRRRAAIAQVIASGYAWDILCEYWGFSGEEAAEAAAEALEILLNRRIAY